MTEETRKIEKNEKKTEGLRERLERMCRTFGEWALSLIHI